jgi:hypothetical protein
VCVSDLLRVATQFSVAPSALMSQKWATIVETKDSIVVTASTPRISSRAPPGQVGVNQNQIIDIAKIWSPGGIGTGWGQNVAQHPAKKSHDLLPRRFPEGRSGGQAGIWMRGIEKPSSDETF